jgi:hypothetical protein
VFKHTGDQWYEVRVAKSLSDLASGKYEYNPNIDWFSDSPRAPDDADVHKKFSVLAPGESFENNSTVSIVVSLRLDHSVAGTVKPGEHVLQLQVSTWNYLEGPDKTRTRWERYGHLFSQAIVTEPLEFRVPANPLFNNCH